MSEEEVITFGQHQSIADQAVTKVVRQTDEPPQQGQIEALANNSGGLKGSPILLCQPVHAREHQALDGSGYGVPAPFFCIV